MSHAFMALAGAALMAFAKMNIDDDGNWRFGALAFAVLSVALSLAAAVRGV